MTVEAAVVIPIFLFFFLNLGCAIEMIRLHGNLQLALWETGNKFAVYGYVLQSEAVSKVDSTEETGQSMQEDDFWEELRGVDLSHAYVKNQVVSYLGKEYLNASPLKQGSRSLNFMESDIDIYGDTFELVVTYRVSPLGSLAGFTSFRMMNRYYGHMWNGYQIEEGDEDYVYMAENGEVYHIDRNCTHLLLSVRQVSAREAWEQTNLKGERYDACEICCNDITVEKVYITDQGECYHYLQECPGLKRTVLRIRLSEADSYPLCSRCGE